MKKTEEPLWPSRKVCDFFECTRSTLSNWRKVGCPGGREGYDIFKVFRWYRKNIISTPTAETSLAEEKLSYARARARLKELELRQKEGTLVEKETMNNTFCLLVSYAKNGFWQLPRRLAEQLSLMTDRIEIEVLLRQEIRKILEELSRGIRSEKKS